MNNLRTYGDTPYRTAVIHGGPGAGGEMAPVARRLAQGRGVLEPIQTATSLDGQVEELRKVLQVHAALPVTLIGYSWGAWLSWITAARYPTLVQKLILVSSGPFEEHYVARLQETRFSRLSKEEQAEFEAAIQALSNPSAADKDARLARLGELATRTDAFDPVKLEYEEDDAFALQGELYQPVWQAAAQMRQNGDLLRLAAQIQCPVVAIHGDYDPHPAGGVRVPLAANLQDFRFILLERCGHTPWLERHASRAFFQLLEKELG